MFGTAATGKAVENILSTGNCVDCVETTWISYRDHWHCTGILEKLKSKSPITLQARKITFFWKIGKTSQVKSNKERVYQLVRDYPVFISAEKNRGKRFVLGDSRLFRLFNNDMATILRLLPSFCWKTTGRAGQLRM